MGSRPAGCSDDSDGYDSDGDLYDDYDDYRPKARSQVVELPPGDQLINAVKYNNVEKVKQLIGEGVDVNYVPSSGYSPLVFACYEANVDIVKTLICAGADVRSTSWGHAPLLAVANSYSTNEDNVLLCFELLLEAGAVLEVVDQNRMTPLMCAAKRNHLTLVAKLISLDVAIDAVEKDGWSALFFAADSGHMQIVQLLKDSGAKIGLEDFRGRTAADIASYKDHEQIFDMLSPDQPVKDGTEVNEEEESCVANHISNYEMVCRELPQPGNRFTGFPSDALSIISGIGLRRVATMTKKQNIQLADVLTLNYQALDPLGLTTFEKLQLKYNVQKYHERYWDKASLGDIYVKEIDLFRAAQLLSNCLRQLHIISLTTYYWKSNESSISGPDRALIKASQHPITTIRNVLVEFGKFARRIDEEQNVQPADYIEHVKPRAKFPNIFVLLSGSALVLWLYRDTLISKLPSFTLLKN